MRRALLVAVLACLASAFAACAEEEPIGGGGLPGDFPRGTDRDASADAGDAGTSDAPEADARADAPADAGSDARD